LEGGFKKDPKSGLRASPRTSKPIPHIKLVYFILDMSKRLYDTRTKEIEFEEAN
jgi:hypothetical protein